MLTERELRNVLALFEFTGQNDIFSKSYASGASIEVDFNRKKITYAPVDKDFREGEFPTKDNPSKGFVIHRETTLNFSANENFVCLICVHLLLKKGYEAKHIVFEPAFKVGHVNKPSYGDILVLDKGFNPLVLIENKTFGAGFSKEWHLMQKNGGQLFSYLGPLVNEIGLCNNLVLFAADFDDKDIILKSHIITLRDNEKRIAELENPKTFTDAKGKYFEVWNETYGKSFETKGLFEDDIAPYTIGKLKYTIADLKALSHAEIKPIYHEFATILRNNAITDFEHSFYILIDLFLCKITDELNNPNDLQFYYKGITRDTPKEYCNRLLKLYQIGKKQLFDVDVVNKDEEDIKQIFEDTNRSVTNGLFAGIKELFEEIKFYNIKKFNFISVENKEEFEMNFQILIKIAALIQDINLSSSEANHFFGDLFEGLLSKNVHQTEGQFFTPLPIVNFIIKSLPEFPDSVNVKVLDYACGAGHFLTEFVKHYPRAKIYGIEKSQTLSQVAKIATIINGSKDSKIVFKDALSYMNTAEARFVSFDKESFDCIIANPPYSVKGFLETLDEKDRNQFELIKGVDEKAYQNNNSIECFFIERAKYFLKTNGIMGIILPISFLSNEGIYTKTRELLFANFNILAIATMNSRTFGSTGTNTIILFAQKVGKNAEGLLNTFIAKKDYKQYLSWKELDNYIKKQGYNEDDYFSFMQDDILTSELANNEIFKDYKKNFKLQTISKQLQREWFEKSTLYKKNLNGKSKEYRALLEKYLLSDEYAEAEKDEYQRQFIAFVKEIECDKLKTFIQTNSNIALLQSPPDKIEGKTNKKEIIKFLGYDWSNRKGDEGIKYITDRKTEETVDDDEKDSEIVTAINSIKFIKTPLYNPYNVNDTTKFSYAIRKHINDTCKKFSFGKAITKMEDDFAGEIPQLFSCKKLSDLIDFSHTEFTKAIKTVVIEKEIISSKYPLVFLKDVATIISGQSPKSKFYNTDENGLPFYQGKKDFGMSQLNEPTVWTTEITKESINGDILMSVRAPVGDVNMNPFEKICIGRGLAAIRANESVKTEYLFAFLQGTKDIICGHDGLAFDSISSSELGMVQIPVPPLSIQQKIAKECSVVDAETQAAYREISKLKESINDILINIKGKKCKLGEIATFKNGLNYSKFSAGDKISIVNVANFGDNKSPIWDEVEEVTIDGTINDSYLLHKDDLITVRSNGSQELVGRFMYIDREPQERTSFSGFSIRVRINNKVIDSELLYYLLSSSSVRKQLTTGSNGANIKSLNQTLLFNVEILIPSIEEQKKILTKLIEIENKITQAKNKITTALERKKIIIKKELL